MTTLALLTAGAVLATVAWWWSNRGLGAANEVALVAVLGVLAATYNTVVPVPNVEASTTVVVCAAIVLGARTGAAVGLVAVLATASTATVGTWTIWQLLATTAVAVLAAVLGRPVRERDPTSTRGRIVLGLVVVAATLVYDLLVTVPFQVTAGVGATAPTFAGRLVDAMLLGAPFTVVHVVATTALTVLVGPALVEALVRARRRLSGGVVLT